MAGVPLGDVLVSDVQAATISGHYCLTASIRVTGVDGMCHFQHVYYKVLYALFIQAQRAHWLCVCVYICVCV